MVEETASVPQTSGWLRRCSPQQALAGPAGQQAHAGPAGLHPQQLWCFTLQPGPEGGASGPESSRRLLVVTQVGAALENKGAAREIHIKTHIKIRLQRLKQVSHSLKGKMSR